MACEEPIALLGADIDQSRERVLKQESQDETNAMPMQIYELHALEKNRRNKLLLQRNLQHHGENVITSQERHLQSINQELEEQEQMIAEIQQINHSLQRQVEQPQKQQTQNDPRPLQLPFKSEVKREQVHCHAQAHSYRSYNKLHPWKMMMTWRDGGRAPFRGSRGASAVKGSMAYFMNWSGEMCFYNSNSKQWGKLPKCPYQFSSLAVVNGHLTAIGGCTNFCDKETYTNKLLSLHSHKTWVEVFPAMPTKRRDTSAVTSKEHLIVAGGMCGPFINSSITTVEVMDVKTLVWSTVASLPHPYTGASGTICGDQLYMLGGSSDEGETKSVLTCSLTELLQ